MKSVLLLSSLSALVLSATTANPFDSNLPIYLGEVFWPPKMTFIA
jgi:hypothetical protein